MFKKPSKKQFIIKRVLLAIVATVSVLVIVTVTIFFMLGYRLDSGNGRLEQGALLQFDSSPNGADVYVNGVLVSGKTATKQTIVAGSHTVKISKPGYETWTRTLTLEAGTLTWLDYIRLIPSVRTVEQVATYNNVFAFDVSPDLKWAILQEKQDIPLFRLLDLRSESVTSSDLTLPTTLYSDATAEGVAHAFSVYNWNSGGRYMLVKHSYKDQLEWLMVDTQDIGRSINITRLLSVGFTDVQFAGTNSTTLFGLTGDGVVRKLDISAGTLSRSLITGVESFTVFNTNIISYIAKDATNPALRVAGVYRDGEESPWVLAAQERADESLRIAAGRYYSDDFIVIANGAKLSVLLGAFPSAGSQTADSLRPYATTLLPAPTTALSVSEEGDFILAQSNDKFVSYELEHKRASTAVIALADGVTGARTLRWLDEAHVWSDDNANLTMRDFNGINAHSLMQVAPGFDASLSQNGRFIYGIGKTDTGYHLQRVKLVLD